uniref:Uncharacterized protein n=1 Tax=Anopheles melas TaxID=34690 RepID=A0A182TFP3_9DIPT
MNSKQSNKQTMLPGSSLVLLVALAGLVMVLLPVGTVPAVHAQQSDRAGALIEPNDALYDARYARIAKEKRESSRRLTTTAEEHESEEFYGLSREGVADESLVSNGMGGLSGCITAHPVP